mgnify:CR=1
MSQVGEMILDISNAKGKPIVKILKRTCCA